ncbi:hypothetical protein [Streptomyces sp. L7]|uniref:hypothetical protein n=1 Tax=Streptomyces sp. L7 TaxID=3423954 RepID=UPI003D986E5C
MTGAFIGYCLLSVAVLRHMFGDAEYIVAILTSAGISTFFWVAVTYAIIRVLFLKADELVQLSFVLPVTNKERTLAFVLFEALIVMAALCAAFGGFAVACLVQIGPAALSLLLTNIAMPAISLYLCFSAGYLLFERVVSRWGLARLRGLLLPAALAGVLLLAFHVVNAQSERFLRAFASDAQYFAPQLLYSWLAETAGLLPATAVFLGFCVAGVLLIQLAAPRSYVPVKRHFKLLPSGLAASRFGAYLLVLVRSFETGVVLLFTAIATVLVWVNGLEVPPFALLLVTFQGVYAFSNSTSVRRIGPQTGQPVIDYLCLVGTQILLLAVMAAPAILVSTASGLSPLTGLAVVGFGIANIILCSLVGIIFAPERGNPFSVLIGVLLMMVVVGTLAIGLNVFNLPGNVNVAFIAAGTVVAAAYSIYGIRQIERNQRRENEVAA